ncbi:MAG TPA: L-threonylcarbamoyladenylate synthase [Longimicrobiales bacterium]|nr:L-threonylcarbamoyladenylate synthase [Longimicrobiales bacterium]
MSQGPARLDLRATVPDRPALAPAVEHLLRGGILAYPTETVYGFGGRCDPHGVGLVRRVKRREEAKPLLVLVRHADEVAGLRWTEGARELARIFWPGSLTLVLEDPDGIFPVGVRSGTGTVAVRVSPHPVVGLLLEGVDGPLTSTSANAPGRPAARSGEEALAAAVSLDVGDEMMVVDVGLLPASPSSTLVDCTGPEPVVVREGTVPLHRLRCALPGIHGV